MRRGLDARLVLVAGIFVFVVAKGFFVVAQTLAMGGPRLGDDAYTHLWRAQQILDVGVVAALRGDLGGASRGTRDLAALCRADAQAASKERAACERVADKIAVPDVKIGASILLAGILELGLPLKWSYALYELVIMAVIAASFAYFLVRLAGPAVAGITLVFMSFMVLLPPQGLHMFVPSTLAIGLSLALWGAVIDTASWRRYLAVAVAFLLLSLVHPVALVYGGGLAVIAACTWRRSLNPKALAALVLAVVVALSVFLWMADAVRAVLANALAGDLTAVFGENLRALPARLAVFARANWALVAAFLASIIFWRRTLDRRMLAAGGALLALLAATLFYRMEFFTWDVPLDLFSRLFVGFAVVCCAVLAKVIAEVIRGDARWRKAAAVACVLLLPLPSGLSWIDTLFFNVNGRHEVVDDAILAGAVAGFERSATLAYGELEIAPTALFLAGAHDLGAIPMQGLSAARLAATLQERRPAAVVFPNFTRLNALAVAGSRTFERRRYGIPASIVDTFIVASLEPISTLHLKVENEGGEPATIGPLDYAAAGEPSRPLFVTVPAGAAGWIAVPRGSGSAASRVVVRLPASDLWVRGITVNAAPRPGVAWPWDSEATLYWHFRNRPPEALTKLVFSVPELFYYWSTPGADRMLPGASRVVADESGIVLVAVDYPAR